MTIFRENTAAEPVTVPTSSNDSLSNESEEITDTAETEERNLAHIRPRVYFQRWIQLGYLSLLALLSDWVCFSFAAAPEVFESYYQFNGRGDRETTEPVDASSLIDIFLFTNVASTLFVTDIVQRVGMKNSIRFASFAMALGCWIRSGFGFLIPITIEDIESGDEGAILVPYHFVVIGTILVGAAQPFFQCTPPLLSATWFASNERATSTAVALNFNQIGIAVAFLVGGTMGTSVKGLQNYNALIAILSTLLLIGTWLYFEESPPTPPSTSELDKLLRHTKNNHNSREPPFYVSVRKFFSTSGFIRALTAFICSISITNVVGAFIDKFVERGGITKKLDVALAGATFEVAIVLGGIFIGGYVDRTKEYKYVTLLCLSASVVFLLGLGLLHEQPVLFVMSLIGLGLVAGPIQPINAELAVDVTYPGDETAVESIQQIGGNLISALLVPLAERASDFSIASPIISSRSGISGDILLLILVSVGTYVYFRGFHAPLQRTIADRNDDDFREIGIEMGTRAADDDEEIGQTPLLEMEEQILS